MIGYVFLAAVVVWTFWACSDDAQESPDTPFLATGLAVAALALLLPIVMGS